MYATYAKLVCTATKVMQILAHVEIEEWSTRNKGGRCIVGAKSDSELAPDGRDAAAVLL